MLRGLVLRVNCEIRDDNEVAAVNKPSRGPIQADLATLAMDHVGREPVAIVAIVDFDLLERIQVGLLAEHGIDRDRSFVIQIRVGDRSTVDF